MAKTLTGQSANGFVWDCIERVNNPDTGELLGIRWLRRYDGLRVIESWTERDDMRWLHVSLSYTTHIPGWAEIKAVKEQFFGLDAAAYIVLPPASHYVNDHPYVLHLFGVDSGADVLPDFRTQLPTGRWTL